MPPTVKYLTSAFIFNLVFFSGGLKLVLSLFQPPRGLGSHVCTTTSSFNFSFSKSETRSQYVAWADPEVSLLLGL